MSRTCFKCSKLYQGQCKVLKELIGGANDCWAFSDNPKWEEEAERAFEEYSGRLKKEV